MQPQTIFLCFLSWHSIIQAHQLQSSDSSSDHEPEVPSPISQDASLPTTFEENISLGWSAVLRHNPTAEFTGLEADLTFEGDDSEENLEPPPYTRSETLIAYNIPASPPHTTQNQKATLFMRAWGNWRNIALPEDENAPAKAPFRYDAVKEVLTLVEALRLAYDATRQRPEFISRYDYDDWVREKIEELDLYRRGGGHGLRYSGLPEDVYFSFATQEWGDRYVILVAVFSKHVFVYNEERNVIDGPFIMPGRGSRAFDVADIE